MSFLIVLCELYHVLFQNILVPFDGSKHSYRAYKIALDVAKRYNSKLTLLTIVSLPIGGSWYVDNRIATAQVRAEHKAIQKEFGKFALQAKKSGVSFNAKIIDAQNVGKSIVSFAKNRKIDLVIMGSHGRTGWDKLILGSVANGVSNRVHCPVLIIK